MSHKLRMQARTLPLPAAGAHRGSAAVPQPGYCSQRLHSTALAKACTQLHQAVVPSPCLELVQLLLADRRLYGPRSRHKVCNGNGPHLQAADGGAAGRPVCTQSV
jgi:hypothetical protein